MNFKKVTKTVIAGFERARLLGISNDFFNRTGVQIISGSLPFIGPARH
jgi:hypothetical protein